MRINKVILIASAASLLCACAIQRAEVANDARAKMVGLSREQVLACMGPPVHKAAEGATEVWAYESGNGYSSGYTTFQRPFGHGLVTAMSQSSSRFCNVNVVMTNGTVSAVNYTGPTGGLLTAGEQCSYAVQHCVGP